jgi:hypothetical protein
MIQGTEGVYSEEHNAVYLWNGKPAGHEWEPFPPYQTRYEHAWWAPERKAGTGADPMAQGHGGTDHLLVRKFLGAVRDRKPLPITLEDSLIMSVVVPLSEQSIAQGSAVVKVPDFTEGKWQTNRPYFALDHRA